jgi:hypothetical protein
MFLKREMGAALMMALLCFTVAFTSSASAGTSWMSTAAESRAVGGNDCGDFLNGFAVGMGVASLFGCAWCPAGVVVAKVAQILVC